ncbi:BolA family transcriptional regulator [Marivivens niveibacter]|uniref:BolA family transcriptional regulator n=1 Tax=Marivivens niveibacter TaxID=1930667 RepID=A0A251WX98_9RHOB|nr:BolA family protein [Marivivens niveibacter]OUD08748.1 BolA family transcriptional regulator [Marivivens niveibacter]
MSLAEQIKSRLETGLNPESVEVIDESEQHIGHAGYQDGGESHWRVIIKASALDDLTRVARHRAIHSAIGADIIGKIHALAIDIR